MENKKCLELPGAFFVEDKQQKCVQKMTGNNLIVLLKIGCGANENLLL